MFKKIRFLLLIIFTTLCFTNCKNNTLKKGTFELYENNKLISVIHRLNNFQVEDYVDGTSLLAKIKWISNTDCYIKGNEKNPKDIDTILFHLKYDKIKENHFFITGKTVNSNINYQYKAKLVKVNNIVSKKYIDTLKFLNKNIKW